MPSGGDSGSVQRGRRVLRSAMTHKIRQEDHRPASDDESNLTQAISRLKAERAERLDRLFDILARISVFKRLSRAQLVHAVGQFMPVSVQANERIVRQGDVGDCCYVIISGEAVVYRQDQVILQLMVVSEDDDGHEIARLSAPNYFGESALLTLEPRKATVRAGPNGASLLRISRQAFNSLDIIENPPAAPDQRNDVKQVVSRCSLFSSLRTIQLHALIDLMNTSSFRPGEFIINGGEIGKNMYIIIEGTCKRVHEKSDNRSADCEKGFKSEELESPAFFGEIALWRRPHPYSVVAKTDVTCMQLRADDFHPKFTFLLKKLQTPELLAESADNAVELAVELAVWAFSWRGTLSRRHRLKALAQAIIRTRRETVYVRLRRKILLATAGVYDSDEIGRIAEHIRRLSPTEGCKHLEEMCEKVLHKPPFRRSAVDVAFLKCLVSCAWAFEDRFCAGWSPEQKSILCRTLKAVQTQAFQVIYGQGAEAGRCYVILRGYVRVRRWHVRGAVAVGASTLLEESCEEAAPLHLGPGDFFGDEVISTLAALQSKYACPTTVARATRSKTGPSSLMNPISRSSAILPGTTKVRSSLVITGAPCDLLVIEPTGYVKALDMDANQLTFEQKIACLRRTPLFKSWDALRLYHLAYILREHRYPKGKVLAFENETLNSLFCVVSGSAVMSVAWESSAASAAIAAVAADGVPSSDHHSYRNGSSAKYRSKNRSIQLLTIGHGDYFGDSGLINSLLPASGRRNSITSDVQSSPQLMTELCSTTVSSAELVALELHASEFTIFEHSDLERLLENRRIRTQWRQKQLCALVRCTMDRQRLLAIGAKGSSANGSTHRRVELTSLPRMRDSAHTVDAAILDTKASVLIATEGLHFCVSPTCPKGSVITSSIASDAERVRTMNIVNVIPVRPQPCSKVLHKSVRTPLPSLNAHDANATSTTTLPPRRFLPHCDQKNKSNREGNVLHCRYLSQTAESNEATKSRQSKATCGHASPDGPTCFTLTSSLNVRPPAHFLKPE